MRTSTIGLSSQVTLGILASQLGASQLGASRLGAGLLGAAVMGLGVGLAPALAQEGTALAQEETSLQNSKQQVTALAEALRLTADQGPGFGSEIYYSAWQVKGSSIPAWSKGCLGHSLTPTQFADSPAVARSVVLCVLNGSWRDEITASGGDEALAVKRVAAWWRTGDADRWSDRGLNRFSQTVAQVYTEQLSEQQKSSQPGPSVGNSKAFSFTGTTTYDRYMSAGYQFSRDNEPTQAVIYFQRALDERPGDEFATNALKDVQRSLNRNAAALASSDADTEETIPELKSEHWVEVAANEAGDRTLVAPASLQFTDGTQTRMAYWEYRAFRGENQAFLPSNAEINQPVRSALLYRAVNCEARNTQVRVMKVYTNQRQEIFAQDFGSAARIDTPTEGSSTASSIAYACGQIGGDPDSEKSPLEQPAIEGAADSIR